MKKIIIIIIALFGCSNSFSQSDTSKSHFDVGIVALAGPGIMYNDLTPVIDIDKYINEYRINYIGGIYCRE